MSRIGDYKLLFGKKFNKQGWYDVDNSALQCQRFNKNKKQKRKDADENWEKKKKRRQKEKNKLTPTIVETSKKNRTQGRKEHKEKRNKKKSNKKKRKSKKNKKKTKKERREEKNVSREKRGAGRRNQEKVERRAELKQEKKIVKIWKDWLPEPSIQEQNQIRYSCTDNLDVLYIVYRDRTRSGIHVQII